MNKNQGILLIFIVILLVGIGVIYSFFLQQSPNTPVKDITIDPGHTSASTLLLVANEQGYFKKNGLNVTFMQSPQASVGIQDLINHKIDFILFNDYTISDPILYNSTIRIIATLSESDTNYVVGRRDRGIIKVGDLEGTKIGVTNGSFGEYFMDRFFVLNGLSSKNVTVIYLSPAFLVDAIVKGDIDVVFSPEPFVYQIRHKMGGNAVVWPVNLGQHSMYSLVSDEKTLQEHSDIAEELLNSVLQAESYVTSHPEDAKKVAQKETNYDDKYMDQDWPNHRLSVGLSQSLITSMEDETRWRMRKNITQVKEVPDFSKYISSDILYSLKPSVVTLIQ